MKKTFTVNISGIVFHIDDDAYEQLGRYLDKLKLHFKTTDGADEIIADIESRMAELLQEKLSPSKQVISLDDINEVVNLLGQPFEMDDDGQAQKEEPKSNFTSMPKRLFRDPDRSAIAGVAAGLAAYFGTDPVIIRILFVILLLLSGTGLLLYIILWIVVPEAKNTTEKLQMHGKPVNINNIEESVKQEYEKVKTKLEGFADEARESYYNQRGNLRKTSDRFVDVLVRVAMVFARVISIIVGFVLLLMGIALMFAFGAFVIGWDGFSVIEGDGFVHFSLATVTGWLLASPTAVNMAPIALVVFFGVPLIMLVYSALRLLIGEHFRIPHIGNSLGMLWLVSLIGIVVIVVDTVADFRHQAGASPMVINIPANEQKPVYFVHSGEVLFNKKQQVQLFDWSWYVEDMGKHALLHAYPAISISKTTSPNLSVWVEASASGISIDDAIARAESTFYEIKYANDTLLLPMTMHFKGTDKLRRQTVKLGIHIPEGQVVHFDKALKDLLKANHSLYYRQHEPMEGNYWIMTANGLQLYDQGSQN